MTTFRERQTTYLRISPFEVVQMVLYIEEYNLSWMSDAVLERMLVALKDKLPVKVRAEGLMRTGKAKAPKQEGVPKTKIDVYRGSDYQIAYYFRKAAKRHTVLLKDKQLTYPAGASLPPHLLKQKTEDGEMLPPPLPNDLTSTIPKVERESVGPGEVTREVLDLTDVADGGVEEDEGEEREVNRRKVEDPLFIKDEEEEVEIPEAEVKDEEDEEKPDLKPTLRVTYTGYSIYDRSLVVVIEPYPPLSAEQRASVFKTPAPTEVHQLSATPAPESYRASTSAPVRPRSSRNPGGAPSLFFRSETTPLHDEEGAAVRKAMESRRGGEETDGDEDELPTVEELLASTKRRK